MWLWNSSSHVTFRPCPTPLYSNSLVPRPRPSTREGTLVDFLGILCVSNHVTHAYAHAHFSNKRVIRIVSCPGGGVWVAVTREFERDNCVISEILQSDWTIPNRAGVPRKSTKVPRPSFRVWAGRSGHETSTQTSLVPSPFCTSACAHPHNRMRVRKRRVWGNGIP